MPLELALHHIGVATRKIEKEYDAFRRLGYTASSEIFIDHAQKIRGIFISAPGQPRLELLENLETSGPLDSYLKNGIKFYHLAYISQDIEYDCARLLQDCRAKILVPVMCAAFFERICFLMLPGMLLVELLELRPLSE